MKVYLLTKSGRKVLSQKEGIIDNEEMRVMRFIRDNKGATEEELEHLVDFPKVILDELMKDNYVQ